MSAATHRWAKHQIEPWAGHGVRDAEDLPVLRRESAFLFTIADGVVRCADKHTHLPFIRRAHLYRAFFEGVVARHWIPPVTFAVDVGDEASACLECPMFSFQRLRGSQTILLPDIDFLMTGFYAEVAVWPLPDKRDYSAKTTTACFVGSTTGAGEIDLAKLRSGAVPRVEAARHFRGHPQVAFRLPNLVQCDEEAEQALLAEGFGTGPLTWQTQLESKFLISMDGNGATCSRVYVALASNSVLLKYASDCEMFYFEGLLPHRHYVPIDRHGDVSAILSAEREEPGLYADIAAASRDFAWTHLTRDQLERYTADLLLAYAAAR